MKRNYLFLTLLILAIASGFTRGHSQSTVSFGADLMKPCMGRELMTKESFRKFGFSQIFAD